jgi:hypothetical protein
VPQKAAYVLAQIERAFSRLSNSPSGVPILKNCWHSAFLNTARFSSNPTASFTESWIRMSTFC